MSTPLVNLNDESLRAHLAEKKTPLLLAFWAPWCGPSAVMDGLLKELASDYQKRVLVGRLNVDENAHSPALYGVKTIPHLILFNKSDVCAQLSGPVPKAKIVELIERHCPY